MRKYLGAAILLVAVVANGATLAQTPNLEAPALEQKICCVPEESRWVNAFGKRSRLTRTWPRSCQNADYWLWVCASI